MDVDPILTDPSRLKIVALLAECEWADFAFVRTHTGLSKSALSKQLTTLEERGYLQLHKDFVGKYPRTRTTLTGRGRSAIEDHLTALQHIVSLGKKQAATNTQDTEESH